jgi:hypothetical protein
MKTGPEPELQLILCHDVAGGKIAVDLNAFVEFDLTLTRSLRQLVAKKLANPAPGRISNSPKRKPK